MSGGLRWKKDVLLRASMHSMAALSRVGLSIDAGYIVEGAARQFDQKFQVMLPFTAFCRAPSASSPT